MIIQPRSAAFAGSARSLLVVASSATAPSSRLSTSTSAMSSRAFATLASSPITATTSPLSRKQHPTTKQDRDSTPSSTTSSPLSSAALQQHDEHTDDSDDGDEYSWSQTDPNHHRRHCQTCACTKSSHLQHLNNDGSRLAADITQAPSDSPTAASTSINLLPQQFNESAATPSSPPPASTHKQHQQEVEQWIEPTAYSVRRRVLPSHLLSLNSLLGQERLIQALQQHTASSYVPLTMHFANQSDPAFCGVTTLLVVLNAFAIDPQTKWKGGWRYYGNEESITAKCCLSIEHIQQHGITLDEFYRLAQCQGLVCDMKRPFFPQPEHPSDDNDDPTSAESDTPPTQASTTSTQQQQKYGTLEDFRRDVQAFLCSSDTEASTTTSASQLPGIVVVSFGRAGLQQTGEGHFSPLAAYHAASDSVLVLDVARFKYPPYWVSIPDLYQAMQLLDTVTHRPRGWFTMQYLPRPSRPHRVGTTSTSSDDNSSTIPPEGEDRRPAHLVPPQQQGSWCPLHVVKVEYCQNQPKRSNNNSSSNATTTSPPSPTTMPQQPLVHHSNNTGD